MLRPAPLQRGLVRGVWPIDLQRDSGETKLNMSDARGTGLACRLPTPPLPQCFDYRRCVAQKILAELLAALSY